MIKRTFKLNGLHYYLIAQDKDYALYGVSGSNTKSICSYEVIEVHNGHLPSNTRWGNDNSRSFTNEHDARTYYIAKVFNVSEMVMIESIA